MFQPFPCPTILNAKLSPGWTFHGRLLYKVEYMILQIPEYEEDFIQIANTLTYREFCSDL